MNRRVNTTELIDLFPFLSVMLCVVGVLAFLQILMSSGIGAGSLLPGQIRSGPRVAYQILCQPNGAVLLPPMGSEGAKALRLIGRAEKDKVLAELEPERCRRLSEVHRQQQKPGALSEANRLQILRELQSVNRAARRHGLRYEEFLFFVVYPGGGAEYHAFRNLLDRPEFLDVPFGLLPVPPEARVEVATCKEATP